MGLIFKLEVNLNQAQEDFKPDHTMRCHLVNLVEAKQPFLSLVRVASTGRKATDYFLILIPIFT